MITGTVTGDREVVVHFEKVRANLRPSLVRRTVTLLLGLENHVKQKKLAGQVLGRKTGKLARSIEGKVYETPNEVGGSVGTDNPIGVMFETTGMAPHVIEARNKQALRFKVDGEFVFARKVNHPGSPPRPFLKPSLAELTGHIIAEYSDAVDDALAP